MKSNFTKAMAALIILSGLLFFGETEALAGKGFIPFIINTGEVIYPVAPMPPELTELAEDPDISNWKLGYKCSHFGILFADIACWDKELVIFRLHTYSEIPAELREELEKKYPFSKTERSPWNKYGIFVFISVIGFAVFTKVKENMGTEKESDQDAHTEDEEDEDLDIDETKCPKCEHERKPGDIECPDCGIIYEKYIKYR
ncbi:MAG: hypothetical protein GY749_37215 [Desulfobacteraceae bacterium]|nr:hypothetical protein [Desulfobacteraceae bacterium]